MRHLPSIITKFIDHKRQKYDTCGNYRKIGKDHWLVEISRFKDWRYEALLLIHEMVEIFLCLHHGISWDAIDKWDWSHLDSDDPGAIQGCPYRKEHLAAERIEKLVAILLGVSWKEYIKAQLSLKWRK